MMLCSAPRSDGRFVPPNGMPALSAACCSWAKLLNFKLTGVPVAQKLFLASFCAACGPELAVPAASHALSIAWTCLIASNGSVHDPNVVGETTGVTGTWGLVGWRRAMGAN